MNEAYLGNLELAHVAHPLVSPALPARVVASPNYPSLVFDSLSHICTLLLAEDDNHLPPPPTYYGVQNVTGQPSCKCL